MKTQYFFATLGLLLASVGSPQSQKTTVVKVDPSRAKEISQIVERICGHPFIPSGATQMGRSIMYQSKFELVTFNSSDLLPFMYSISKRPLVPKNQKPLNRAQLYETIQRLIARIQFNTTDTKLRVNQEGAEPLPSTNSNSYFVYYEEFRRGILGQGYGKMLHLQVDSRTGELLSFTCRRKSDVIGGSPMAKATLDKIATKTYKGLDLSKSTFRWMSPKRFKSTEHLDPSNGNIMAVYMVPQLKIETVRFFRADNGKYLGRDSPYGSFSD